MRLYHRTRADAAEKILTDGFRDSTGYYFTSSLHTSVWLSDIPLDENEGASGEVLLAIEIPVALIREFEWVEEGKPYREFLVPAAIVNKYSKPRIIAKEGAS